MDIFYLSGDKLRQIRENLRISREKLSEMSGIAPRTIEDIETGRSKNPGIETLKPLLAAMGVPSEKEAIERSELILQIIAALPAINNPQLTAILNSIRTYAAISKSSGS